MSTETDPRIDADPFRYGWREVSRELPDGRVEFDTVPLTSEDLLYPQEDDHAMQTREHVELFFYLYSVFHERLQDVPGALLLGDHRIDYDVPGVRPLGPDLAVFMDVANPPHDATFDLATTAGRGVLVVELTSLNTRGNDFGIKMDVYHRAGVAFYAIVDLRPRGRDILALYGFQDTPNGYEPAPLDNQGRLWLEALNLWLAIVDNEVVCIDGATGERIGGYDEQVQGRRSAENRVEVERIRAEAERARADAAIEAQAMAEAKMRALEEEIRRLRGESGQG